MFDRYTEGAKKTVFFARYEASQRGSPHIEPEHLLLGLLREDRDLMRRVFRSRQAVEEVRASLDETVPRMGEKISTSVDLPLSADAKRVLHCAAEEAKRLKHKHIGTVHLLLGVMRM